jgi:hypothetical protein
MNTVLQYSSLTFSDNETNRNQCLDYLNSKNFSRVIDVGASANFWAPDYVTHCFDINESPATNQKISFIGNINDYEDWSPVLKDVEENGKFDFAVCTHTLEDICNPKLVCKMLSRIAKKGFIAVPSKYYELTRHEGQYRGWQHHRWIFDKQHSTLIAYPKLPFVDYIQEFDTIAQSLNPQTNGELQCYWQDEVNLVFVNNDYLGPSPRHVYGYYANLLNQ